MTSFRLIPLLAAALALPAHAATTCTFTTDPVAQLMTLDADCTTDETLFVPDGWTLDGAGNTITALGPVFKGSVIKNAGTIAHVRNVGVTATGLPCECHGVPDERIRGILFDGAGGSITDTVVTDMNQGSCGCQEGNGIEVRNAPFNGTNPGTHTVLIARNEVVGYQKNGITTNGDLLATIVENHVEGGGMVPFIAQNGIQVGYGAEGTVKDNVVDGNWFTGDDWTAAGLLLFEVSGVRASGNEIRENQSGVVVESWHFQAPAADGNRIQNNAVLDNQYGVIVDAYTMGSGLSQGDSSASFNKVVANSILNDTVDGEIGVFLGTGYAFGGESTGFTPSAVGNQVHGNKIGGFADGIVEDGSEDSKISGNQIAEE